MHISCSFVERQFLSSSARLLSTSARTSQATVTPNMSTGSSINPEMIRVAIVFVLFLIFKHTAILTVFDESEVPALADSFSPFSFRRHARIFVSMFTRPRRNLPSSVPESDFSLGSGKFSGSWA